MEIPKKREPRAIRMQAANDALEKSIQERKKAGIKEREERNKRLGILSKA